MMKKFMSLETLEIIHDTTHVLTMPLSIVIGIWYAPKYGYERKKAAIYSLIMMIIILNLNNLLKKWQILLELKQ